MDQVKMKLSPEQLQFSNNKNSNELRNNGNNKNLKNNPIKKVFLDSNSLFPSTKQLCSKMEMETNMSNNQNDALNNNNNKMNNFETNENNYDNKKVGLTSTSLSTKNGIFIAQQKLIQTNNFNTANSTNNSKNKQNYIIKTSEFPYNDIFQQSALSSFESNSPTTSSFSPFPLLPTQQHFQFSNNNLKVTLPNNYSSYYSNLNFNGVNSFQNQNNYINYNPNNNLFQHNNNNIINNTFLNTNNNTSLKTSNYPISITGPHLSGLIIISPICNIIILTMLQLNKNRILNTYNHLMYIYLNNIIENAQPLQTCAALWMQPRPQLPQETKMHPGCRQTTLPM